MRVKTVRIRRNCWADLVSATFNTDLYIVDRFPLSARPFYTMPAPDDARYSNSYDVYLRGEEITSGAQRVHEVQFTRLVDAVVEHTTCVCLCLCLPAYLQAALLEKQAKAAGIAPSALRAYIDSFRAGAPPHGGAGIGLDRFASSFKLADELRDLRVASGVPFCRASC